MGERFTIRDMTARLIGFDTVSRHSNLKLISFVEDYLAGHGIASTRVANDEGSKANLFATIGPHGPGGVVLSGHTDVVPVDGQDWSSDPFAVVEKDGALFGRGACDMKSFIAIGLALVPDFLAANIQKPIHFALSYDEEVGCLGVRPMIDQIIREMPRPEVVIVGEPSDMKVINAHKSIYAFRTEVTGLEAHSSATDMGVNSVMAAARLIGFLSDMAEEMRGRGDASGRFQPPYTSLNVGTITGGTALNIIPKQCSFAWEYRALPDLDPEEIISRFEAFAEEQVLPGMRAVHGQAQIVTHRRAHVPALRPEEGSAAESLVLQLAERNRAEAVSYGTEAGLFQLADVPTVVCGPGSILQAHKPDEFVTLAQLDACEAFMRRLIAYLAAA